MNADQIAEVIFNKTVSPRWVRQVVAPTMKMALGHSTVVWWERDVLNWLNEFRRGGGQ